MSKQYEKMISNITKREGKKVSISRGNVKEVLKVLKELDGEFFARTNQRHVLEQYLKTRPPFQKRSISGYLAIEAAKYAIKLLDKKAKRGK